MKKVSYYHDSYRNLCKRFLYFSEDGICLGASNTSFEPITKLDEMYVAEVRETHSEKYCGELFMYLVDNDKIQCPCCGKVDLIDNFISVNDELKACPVCGSVRTVSESNKMYRK